VTSPRIETGRLLITLLEPGMDRAMVEFLDANRAHFAPWDPPLPEERFTDAYWHSQALKAQLEFQGGSGFRFVSAAREAPQRIIGTANYSQVSRGPFQAAFLGYKIDRDAQGKGMMREALRATLDYMFDVQHLHRIHANYVPQNVRSGNLLARLGFAIEGYAKDYLFIDGAWRDHVLTSLTHPRYDPAWLVPSSGAVR